MIEAVAPVVDGGRYPIKRTVSGELVRVEADIFTDGHDAIAACVLARREGSTNQGAGKWLEIPMKAIVNGNDRWTGTFGVSEIGPLCIQGAGMGGSF